MVQLLPQIVGFGYNDPTGYSRVMYLRGRHIPHLRT